MEMTDKNKRLPDAFSRRETKRQSQHFKQEAALRFNFNRINVVATEGSEIFLVEFLCKEESVVFPLFLWIYQ